MGSTVSSLRSLDWTVVTRNAPDFASRAKTPAAAGLPQLLSVPLGFSIVSFVGIIVSSSSQTIYGEAIWSPIDLLGRFLDNNPSHATRFGVRLTKSILYIVFYYSVSYRSGSSLSLLLSLRFVDFLHHPDAFNLLPWSTAWVRVYYHGQHSGTLETNDRLEPTSLPTRSALAVILQPYSLDSSYVSYDTPINFGDSTSDLTFVFRTSVVEVSLPPSLDCACCHGISWRAATVSRLTCLHTPFSSVQSLVLWYDLTLWVFLMLPTLMFWFIPDHRLLCHSQGTLQT